MKEYLSVVEVAGPLVVVEGIKDVAYGEIVHVFLEGNIKRMGQVLEVSKEKAVVQMFEGTTGINTKNTKVRFSGQTMKIPVSPRILGRVFNGAGDPLDDLPAISSTKRLDINGSAINPYMRDHPRDFIQTGISTIDLMNTLVRGQKLPLFSAAGLPHNRLAAQIAKQSKILNDKESFAVVFAAMGITYEEALFFRKELEQSGAFENSVLFLNLAHDPAIERIITPRLALTVAEYLAFELDKQVLVIMTDMTNYCEALREIAAARNEVPGRRGYPGYMYTDLASLYERAGRIKGKKGSVTQIPILSMPADDITHPIADLTGYITEGQIVLSRELHRLGIYPPIDVLPSLSRLMKNGIGKGKTREDHPSVSDQMYAFYAQGRDLRDLVAVVGEESLEEHDKKYLKFAEQLEKSFVHQGQQEERSIIQSLSLAWGLLGAMPSSELKRIKEEFIKCYSQSSSKKQETTMGVPVVLDESLYDA